VNERRAGVDSGPTWDLPDQAGAPAPDLPPDTTQDATAAVAPEPTSPRTPLKPAYLILGDDLPKVEYALRRLRARIVEQSGSDLNIDEFDASVHGSVEVVNAANTLAFLGGTRLVLVQNVQAWLKTDKEIVVAYLKSPAPAAWLW
jgi:DNA polymerase III delta subunit